MEWLTDRLLVRFGRHEAPLIIAPKLGRTYVLLFQGILSNQRSQPVITDWFGLLAGRGGQWQSLGLAEVLAQTDFMNGLPNTSTKSALQPKIEAALTEVVAKAREHMTVRRKERAETLRRHLKADERKLQVWYDASMARLAAQRQNAVGALAARLTHEQNEIEKLFTQRREWLRDTFTTVDLPYLRLVAVFSGE
jgi:hypothetical protein